MTDYWKILPLGDLCDILDYRRKPVTKRDRKLGAYPYYGATGLLDYVDEFLFDEKLVLIGEDGAKWGAGENSAYIIEGKSWVNNHAHVLRPNRNMIMDEWIVYYINFSDLTEFVTGLTVPKLNQAKLREIPIPVPPLPEQRRIVHILDEAFAAIAVARTNAEKNLQNAREVFQGYLNEVISQCVQTCQLSTLGELFDITSSKRVFESEWKREGVPFYRAREIVILSKQGYVNNELFISEEMFREYSTKFGIPKDGDIMVTGVGTLGICYVVRKNDRFYFKDGNIIWLKKRTNVNSHFVEFAFKSDFLRKQIDDSIGATVGTYTIIKAKGTQIPLPPLKEQNEIVTNFQSISEKTKQLETIYLRKIASLDALKQSLLHQAFSGEL